MIQTLISDFSATQNQYREQFFDRKESLLAAIRNGKIEAAKKKKLDEYIRCTQEFVKKVKEIDDQIDSISENYSAKIKKCTSSSSCVQIKNEFVSALRKALNEFDEIVVQYEIVCLELTNQASIVSLRDEIMRATTAKNTRLESLAQEVWLKAEDAIKEYTNLGPHINAESSRLLQLRSQRDAVKDLKNEIHIIADEIYSQLSNATTEDSLNEIKISMDNRYKEIETQLQEIRKGLAI